MKHLEKNLSSLKRKKLHNPRTQECFQGVEKGYFGNKWAKLIRCDLFHSHFECKEYMAKKKLGNINLDEKVLKVTLHFLNSIIRIIAITPL